MVTTRTLIRFDYINEDGKKDVCWYERGQEQYGEAELKEQGATEIFASYEVRTAEV